MNNKKVLFSKKILKDTLIDLMVKKELYKISISELCDFAGLNRSTFYAHYENINSLVKEIESDVISKMPMMSYSNSISKEEIMKYAEYIEQNYKIINVLTRNCFFTQSAIDQFVNRYINNELPKQKTKEINVGLFRFIATYTISGMVQSIAYWTENKNSLSIQQIALILIQLCNYAINIREKYETIQNI